MSWFRRLLLLLLFLMAGQMTSFGDDCGPVPSRQRVYIVRGVAGYWQVVRIKNGGLHCPGLGLSGK